MKLAAFAPPGNLTDLDASQRTLWSGFISGLFEESRAGSPAQKKNDSPRPQFYNPTLTDTADDAQSAEITWIGFPRLVRINSVSDQQRWRRADLSRSRQDEYCEWSVQRRGTDNKITRVTFTSEGPEYWRFLARANPGLVVELYQQFVDPRVRRQDLFDSGGNYNPLNAFNSTTTGGAMHLVQPNNTLSAEIEIAAAATIVRVIDGQTLTGEQELIECGQYGQPERNSDPHIGGQVNDLARQKADITLADPVGLYLGGLSTVGWSAPDGADPHDFWTIVRGDADHPVRAVYEVPADRGYVVGDITIDNRPIEFGAQIADFITIKLTGVACRFGQSTAAPITGCVEFLPQGLFDDDPAASASAPSRTFR